MTDSAVRSHSSGGTFLCACLRHLGLGEDVIVLWQKISMGPVSLILSSKLASEMIWYC